MSSGNEMSPRSPALIILSGLPGSGKTTFATALLREFPAVHIESDAVRRRIASNPRYTLAENRRVFDEVERRAASAIASGHVALIDATNLREQDRLRFFSLAAQSRVDALYRLPQDWARKAVLNVAGMGVFSSDRTIREYTRTIWNVAPRR